MIKVTKNQSNSAIVSAGHNRLAELLQLPTKCRCNNLQNRFAITYIFILQLSAKRACKKQSKQMNVEFDAYDYGTVKKVYSIWICMNTPRIDKKGKQIGGSIVKYRTIPEVVHSDGEEVHCIRPWLRR